MQRNRQVLARRYSFVPESSAHLWLLIASSWSLLLLRPVDCCIQFDLAGSARLDVLVSAIEPRQASQIVKDLSELLPLERAEVS